MLYSSCLKIQMYISSVQLELLNIYRVSSWVFSVLLEGIMVRFVISCR